jgi:colicin import membrane protein
MSSYARQKTPLQSTMIFKSALLHLGIFCAFTFKTVFFPSEPIIYQAAIRVDLVGLPEKKIQKVAPAKKPSPKKVSLQKPEKKNIKQIKKSQKQALDRIKALMAIEDSLKKQEERPAAQIKGNRISPGTALAGLDKMEYLDYIGELDSHVKQHWTLPEWLADGDFSARAHVKIDEFGYVVHKKIIRSSNNPTYDSLVMKAIDDASPFPKPPDQYADLVKVDGIVFGFPE